jgi:hypothetical protein
MKGRKEFYLSAGLLLLLAVAGYYFLSSRDDGAGLPGVLASDTKFEPLQVREPELRIDLLEKVRKLDYTGSHRNIFLTTPALPPKPVGQPVAVARAFVGPKVPPPPPPLQVPAEFFGYAAEPHGGNRVAFFASGDDVLVVGQGETFLGRFRLDHINNDSADVEEVGTGRHTTLQLVQPPDQGASH